MYPLAVCQSEAESPRKFSLTLLRDVKAGILYIRSLDYSIWKPHPIQWKIDIAISKCYRHTYSKEEETLVDPHSGLFARISMIFKYFEYRHHLTIYQPSNHSITVDLPRMQLRWQVNKNHQLQCRHLASELDPDQVRLPIT